MAKRNLPAVASDGAIMAAAGKYARSAVLQVFEQLGGVPAMTEWAEENKGEFYTKLFPKIITRETEAVKERESVEDLLDAIDADFQEVENEKAVDADFEDV